MEFSEVYNRYHTFDNFVTIEEAKATGIIPASYINAKDPAGGIFPNRCKCGSQNIISRNLKRAMCCNPKCKIKMGLALAELFARLGVKGLGEATCIKFISLVYDKLQYASHLEVFLMKYDDYPPQFKWTVIGEKMYIECQKARKTPMTFSGMVTMLGLPEFGNGAADLFYGFHSFEEFFATIKKFNGIQNYCSSRGVYDKDKLFWLYCSMTDIMVADHVFYNIRREGLRKIKVCITGILTIRNVRVSRKEYVDACNNIAKLDNGLQLFEIENTAAKETCSYVIADYPSNSAKYLAGKKRGVLITGDGFITKLKEAVEQCKLLEQQGASLKVVETMNLF